MSNESGIYPVGHRLLILPKEVEETTDSGIVLHYGDEVKREAMAQVRGVVIAMGDTCYHDQPGSRPWCKVGDVILFGKYTGLVQTGKDKVQYRIINDLDVVAAVE